MRISDWRSDGCSSDLVAEDPPRAESGGAGNLVIRDAAADIGTLNPRREMPAPFARFRIDRKHIVEAVAGVQQIANLQRRDFQPALVAARAVSQAGAPSQLDAADVGWRDLVGRAEPRSEEHTSELQSLMRISYAV